MNKKFTVEAIQKYMNIPFKDCGRDFDGCDCGGLVWLIYKNELDIELPKWNDLYSTTQYSNSSEIEKVMSSMLGANGKEVPISRIQPFDVLSIRIGRAEMHVGTAIDKERFIHICEGDKVTCERINSMKWKNRITGAFRHESMFEKAR